MEVAPSVGAWVLAIGLARYAFLAAGWASRLAARAAAPARLAQDGRRRRRDRARDRGLRGPAAGREQRLLGDRARPAGRVVRPGRLVARGVTGTSAPARPLRPAPAHPAGAAALTLLALLVVWVALVAPIRPWHLTPGCFVPDPARRARPRRASPSRCPAAPGASCRGWSGRRSACSCWSSSSTSGSSSPSTGRSTRSRTGATSRSASGRCATPSEQGRRPGGRRGDVLGLAALVVPTLAVRPPDAGRGPPPRGARCGSPACSPPPGCSAGRSAPQSSRAPASRPRARPTSQSTRCGPCGPTSAIEARFSAADPPQDRYRNTPAGRLLNGLRGKDVLLVFVESYGKLAVQGTSFSPASTPSSTPGREQLQAAGFSSRSGWLTSSTFGGGSWLAHATLQSGTWVNSPGRYSELIAASADARRRVPARRLEDGRRRARRPTAPGRRARRSTATTRSTTAGTSAIAARSSASPHARPVRAPGPAEARAGQAAPPPGLRRDRPRRRATSRGHASRR